MLLSILEKYHSSPGFALLLGCLLQYMNAKQPYTLLRLIRASWCLIRQQGKGNILDNLGSLGASGFLTYFTEFLENSDRSGTRVFDQQRYATAANECLQLYLCSHCNFSKGATESACHDKVLLRNKPWTWKARLGVYSRIRESRHHLQVQQRESLVIRQYASFPDDSFEDKCYKSLSYQWALDILPFLLERSAISLELAEMLRGCTFAMMAWEFPRRVKLAKKAKARYLLRVESAVGA